MINKTFCQSVIILNEPCFGCCLHLRTAHKADWFNNLLSQTSRSEPEPEQDGTKWQQQLELEPKREGTRQQQLQPEPKERGTRPSPSFSYLKNVSQIKIKQAAKMPVSVLFLNIRATWCTWFSTNHNSFCINLK